MKKNVSKRIFKVLKLVAILYVAIGLLIYLLQDLFILHPKSLKKDHQFNFNQPFNELNITANDGRNINIVQFITDKKPKGVVLYFHGNMRNIERYAGQAKSFTRNNYEVWMIDYPGFGKSTGKFSEESVYADALILYKLAIKRYAPENIIIYGRSLGTGIASYLAATKECQQVILETPYYSMEALANSYFPIYPAKQLIKYHFPNYKNLQKVFSPITIIHGNSDEIIPYHHSRKLKEKIPAINLVTLEKGKHNNLSGFTSFQTTIDSLLND